MIDFKEEIKDLLESDKREKEEVVLNKFSPYYLGQCKRQMFVEKIGLSVKDKGALGAMKLGSLVHNWLEDELEVDGITKKEEPLKKHFNVNGGYPIYVSGRYDVASDGYIYDYKTITNMSKAPKEVHKRQLECYLRLAGVDKGGLVYLGKRVLKVKQVEVERDEERWQTILDNAKEVMKEVIRHKVNGHIEVDEVPFKRCGCTRCKYEKLKDMPYKIPIVGPKGR